jgi:hypothetical protein
MRKLIVNILLRLLCKPYFKPLSEPEVEGLLIKLARTQGLEKLPNFLDQCSTTMRNQFLYTGDEKYKGAVLALVSLRERILDKQKSQKKKLTLDEENVIMKKRGY